MTGRSGSALDGCDPIGRKAKTLRSGTLLSSHAPLVQRVGRLWRCSRYHRMTLVLSRRADLIAFGNISPGVWVTLNEQKGAARPKYRRSLRRLAFPGT